MTESADPLKYQAGFPQKTVFIARKDLEPREVVNAIGHCAMAVGWARPEGLIVSPVLQGSDGVAYSGVSAWPFIVLTTRASKLERVRHEARAREDLRIVEFLRPMLTTTTDEQLVAEVAASTYEDLSCMGLMLHGVTEVVDSLTGSLSLWQGSGRPGVAGADAGPRTGD